MTAIINLSQVRGDDLQKTVTLDQPLSSFSELWFTVRTADATTQTDDTDAVFAGSLSGGELAAAGTYSFTVTADSDTTVLWTASTYVYDVQVKTLAGKIYTAAYGRLRMLPDVTRRTA